MSNEYQEVQDLVERIFCQHFEEAVVKGTDENVDLQKAIDETTSVIRERIHNVAGEVATMREEKKAEIKAEIREIIDEVLAEAKSEMKQEVEDLQTVKEAVEEEVEEEAAQEQQGLWSKFVDHLLDHKGKYVLACLSALAVAAGGLLARNRHETAAKLDAAEVTGEIDAPQVVRDIDAKLAA